jgi:pSer/pThr/pTyr-binding forkhead associated (FHA) protein
VSALGSTTPQGSPPICWRCRGIGELGAEFCKFCGARFGDVAHAGAPPVAAAPAAPPVSQTPGVAQPQFSGVASVVPASAPAPRPSATIIDSPRAPGAAAATPPAQLVAILKDGSDGRVFPLFDDQTDIGRLEGEIVFGDDPYLSPRHARIARKGESWRIRDLDSINGVYARIREPVDLTDGDMILIGQQVLRFETLSDAELPLGPATTHGVMVFGTPEVPRMARLVQYTTEGVGRDVHYLYRDETVLGRENGDIVFTDDPFLSRRHAAIMLDRAQKRFTLKDLGSSNGSAIRFHGERALVHGEQFRIGRHLFRFDLLRGANGGRGGP